jgi:hypothetical protein
VIKTDAEIWTFHENENGSGTGSMIDIVGQSATGIGIDGRIENVRLVQVDETATATTVIANILALSHVVNLTHALFLPICTHCIDFPRPAVISHVDAVYRISWSAVSLKHTQ